MATVLADRETQVAVLTVREITGAVARVRVALGITIPTATEVTIIRTLMGLSTTTMVVGGLGSPLLVGPPLAMSPLEMAT